jgi:HAD superfamily hydrolase (TIGR01549 family)
MISLSRYLDQTNKKYLIFDLDKTLLDLRIDWTDFREQFTHEVSSKIDRKIANIIDSNNGSSQDLYNQVIIKHGYSAKVVIDQFCQQWEQSHLLGFEENTSLTSFINQSSKYTFFIWTGNNLKTAEHVIKQTSWCKLISLTLGKESTNLSKPFPDGFYLIFNHGGGKRSDYLMIGDSQHDSQAAANAGIDFFQVKPFGSFINQN